MKEKKELDGNILYEYFKYKGLLYDKVTGLPTVPVMLEELRKWLDIYQETGVIVIDIGRYGRYEKVYGWERVDHILKLLAEKVKEFLKKKKKVESILVCRAQGDDIVLFIKPPSISYKIDIEYVKNYAEVLRKYLYKELINSLPEEIKRSFNIYIGYSVIFNDPNVRFERLIFRGVKEAGGIAANEERREKEEKILILKETIKNRNIKVVFQPIVDIINKDILGYEALSRGPANTELENPEIMFSLATEADLVVELERACREAALRYVKKLEPKRFIFINTEPEAVYDPALSKEHIVKHAKVEPDYIVLEITERTAIRNFNLFKKHLTKFKKDGFKVSIDDAGSGYASLQSIAMFKPDFIKFDVTLIRNINNDFVKQEIVSLLIELANKMNIKIIAEGVETLEEYKTIKALGVQYAQGFLFARPGEPFVKPKFPD